MEASGRRANDSPLETSAKRRKKGRDPTPASEFHHALTACSKSNDISAALALYDAAVSSPDSTSLINAHHFNNLLHICSTSVADDAEDDPRRMDSSAVAAAAFRIFDHMVSRGIRLTEATVTSMARIAAAASDECGGGRGDRAFELVKEMGSKYGLAPKLRTYGPALLAFCRRKEDAEKAYAVEEHMISMDVPPEEQELAALLRVSSDAARGDKVYEYMQKLRSCGGCVGASTADIAERWFRSEAALEIGLESWDGEMVKDAILKNGGGWHGKGWLGKGKWNVIRTKVGPDGSCYGCGERLTCVDIGQVEVEKFAEAVASFAREREVGSNFSNFQEWLNSHVDYEAIVDGANIGFYQQNFAEGGFSMSQLDTVVRELCERNNGSWPLIILHNKRILTLKENPPSRQMIENWQAHGALYTTPNGSNDDWYWLYAAVKLKCLLITNDEMRDHIFELLGNKYFTKWKERHQVRYTFIKGHLKLDMPHPFSVTIQESERGSWHMPLHGEPVDETLRTWLCITRDNLYETTNEVVQSTSIIQSSSNSSQQLEDVFIASDSERKERSPSRSKQII